jgi:hypothetical protein
VVRRRDCPTTFDSYARAKRPNSSPARSISESEIGGSVGATAATGRSSGTTVVADGSVCIVKPNPLVSNTIVVRRDCLRVYEGRFAQVRSNVVKGDEPGVTAA